MAEDKRTKKKNNPLIPFLIFLFTMAAIFGGSVARGLGQAVLIRNMVLGGIGCGTVLFLMAQCRVQRLYDYDNEKHSFRFFLWYMLSLMLALACAYLPAAGWPFLAIFVCLSLFSNTLIGITAGASLLGIAAMLTDCGISIFLLYFMCGVAGACFFRMMDESYRIGVPVTLSVLVLFVAETAGVALFTNESLSLELFAVPLMNVIISAILLLVLLRFFFSLVVYRYRDKYLFLNDQECPLLTELKGFSREEYYQAVHTAYFCGRIAARLRLDGEAAKAGGYYHRIGRMRGKDSWECVERICEEYAFPPAAGKILKEYLDTNTKLEAKETAVVLLSDAVISAIRFLFAKDDEAKVEYDQVIDTVFRKKLDSGILQDCRLTIQEYTMMKKIFKEEKLYYDFLR